MKKKLLQNRLAFFPAFSARQWRFYSIACLSLILISCGKTKQENLNNRSDSGVKIELLGGHQQPAVKPGDQFSQSITIRLVDPDGIPLPGVQIEFIPSNIAMSKPLKESTRQITANHLGPHDTETKEDGTATAIVVAGNTFNTQIHLKISTPEIPGVTETVILETIKYDQPAAMLISTSRDLKVIAGDPFSFVVSIIDKGGYLVENFNETLALSLEFKHTPSWYNKTAQLPLRIDCTFKNGICTTAPDYFFTNALEMPQIKLNTVTYLREDGSQITIEGVGSTLVTVEKGGPAAVAITTEEPAEMTNVTPLSTLVVNVDDATKFYASIIDTGGNFIRSVNAEWESTGVIERKISPTKSSDNTVLKAHQIGKGTIVASYLELKGTSPVIEVEHGDFYQATITTEHGMQEYAATCFSFSIQLEDKRGNPIKSYNGKRAVKLSLLNTTSGPEVRKPAHFQSGEIDLGPSIVGEKIFFAGKLVPTEYACIYDATAVKPRIKVEVAASPNLAALDAISDPINMNKTAVHYITLSRQLGESTEYACPYEKTEQNCLVIKANAKYTTFYAAAMDKGGNFLSNPQVTWDSSYPLTGKLTSTGDGAGAIIYPQNIGSGVIVMHSAELAFDQTLAFTIEPGELDHFEIVTENQNQEVAIFPFYANLIAKDSKDNHIFTLNADYELSFSLVGSDNSPIGTPPATPKKQLVKFVSGIARVGNAAGDQFYLPNVASSARLVVQKEGLESVSPLIFVQPGPPVKVIVEDKGDGKGSPIPNYPNNMILSTKEFKVFFAAGYDNEGNYTGDVNSAWSATGALKNFVQVFVGPKTFIAPKEPGNGTVIAKPIDERVISSTTPDITIQAIGMSLFDVKSGHDNTEVAFQKFSLIIRALDGKNNLVADYLDGDGRVDIEVNHNGVKSWAGVAPIGRQVIDCHFINGVCETSEIFYLTQADVTTTIFVKDLSQQIQGLFGVQVNVTKGASWGLAIKDGLGGPGVPKDVGFPKVSFVNKMTFNAYGYLPGQNIVYDPTAPVVKQQTIRFYAAIIDQGGNYIEETPVLWLGKAYSGTGDQILDGNKLLDLVSASNFSTSAQSVFVDFNPIKVGEIKLFIVDGNAIRNLTAYNTDITLQRIHKN